MSATIAALTTTFTPAPSCTQLMFSAPIYKVWLNEPMAAPSSTLTDCFPKEFLQGYASVSPSSSIAPLMSPLFCPQGYTTAFRTSASYIACCPSSYQMNFPDTTVDTNRPAYGGTCFSDILSGQTLTVTQYTDTGVFQTQTISSTLQSGQAFAHPIDGIDAQAVLRPVATSTPTSNALTLDTAAAAPQPSSTNYPSVGLIPIVAAPTSTSSSSASAASASAHPALSGSDIAGIAVGITGAVAMVGAILLFFFFRHRDHPSSPSNPHHIPTIAGSYRPPLPEKDWPPSHNSSVRSSPIPYQGQRSHALAPPSVSPPMSSMPRAPPRALQPPERTMTYYTFHPRDQNEPREVYAGETYTELPVTMEQRHELFSPTRQSRADMSHASEMEGSDTGTKRVSRVESLSSYYSHELEHPTEMVEAGGGYGRAALRRL